MSSQAAPPILIMGSPRSGTTWIAKIFDSHPDVLYRHEPDHFGETSGLPGICSTDQIPSLLAKAQKYLDELTTTRTVKTAGPMPFFQKSFRSVVSHHLRVGINSAARLGERVSALKASSKTLSIPDLIRRQCAQRVRIVLKSVDALGRAELYGQARPTWPFIFVIRHPCGQVASMLRGTLLGKFDLPFYLDIEQARQHGLTAQKFEALRPFEQLAWNWAILNEMAVAGLSGRDAVKLVSYEGVCTSPMSAAQELLAFVGLAWSCQTETFLQRSTTYHGPDRYYQVFKDVRAAPNKWRSQLNRSEQERVLEIAHRTSIGRMYSDLESDFCAKELPWPLATRQAT